MCKKNFEERVSVAWIIRVNNFNESVVVATSVNTCPKNALRGGGGREAEKISRSRSEFFRGTRWPQRDRWRTKIYNGYIYVWSYYHLSRFFTEDLFNRSRNLDDNWFEEDDLKRQCVTISLRRLHAFRDKPRTKPEVQTLLHPSEIWLETTKRFRNRPRDFRPGRKHAFSIRRLRQWYVLLLL